MKEWLPRLNVRHKWFKARRDFKVGDTVIMLSTDSAHGKWKLAQILEIYLGKGGHVTVTKKKVNGNELIRLISK